MSATVDRLRWAIGRSRLSQAAIERAATIAPGTLSHVIRGRRSLTQGAAQRLEAVLHARAAWLLFGERPAWWIVRAADGRCAINEPGPLRAMPLLYADSRGRPTEFPANTRFTLRPRAVLRAIHAEETPFNDFDTVRIVAVTPKIERKS